MRNILLKIEYDGTDFCGWQRQPHAVTVQGTLEQALAFIFKEDISIDGTGRTDAGVHALGQCATFTCEDSGIPTDRIPRAVNDLLAASKQKAGAIRVLSAAEVPPDFHARFSALGKTYVYRIFDGEAMPAFFRNYMYHVKKPLDLEAMRLAGECFVGEHDFAAFMAAGSYPQKTTVRTIYGLHVEKEGDTLAIAVTGNGFLYNMVRIITGTLVDVGLGRIQASDVAGIIDGKDRALAGHTAPPQGLYMAEVYFTEEKLRTGAQASRIKPEKC